MDDIYQKRLEAIDKEIKEIKENQNKWTNEGGIGPRKALYANLDIKKLEEEKERILSGRQEKIDNIKQVQQTLEALKKKSRLLKRRAYSKEIKGMDKELEELRKSK